MKCLVYREDAVSKTHDGGIQDRKSDWKEVWIYPNDDNVTKCTVRLVEKYLSNFQGYFTNHSLRRTGGTRLFRAGVDRKLVKEVTGHCSDSVDSYQITGHDQRRVISNIVQGRIKNVNQVGEVKSNDKCDVVVKDRPSKESDKVVTENVTLGNVTEIVKKIAEASSRKGKTIIRLEIEIHNE